MQTSRTFRPAQIIYKGDITVRDVEQTVLVCNVLWIGYFCKLLSGSALMQTLLSSSALM